MNRMRFLTRKFAALFTFATLLVGSQLASAVNLAAYTSVPQQYGSGSAFNHGLTVMASTTFTTLTAGGNYSVQCANPGTLPVTGERVLSAWKLGGSQLYVTVPASLPGLSNISGWNNVGAEADLACNYRWTAFAQEGGYSISIFGVSFPIGNGLARDGGVIDFTMYRGLTGAGGGGCGP